MRGIVAACAAAFVFGATMAGPAAAKTDVDIYFGFPHFDYQVGPDYRFRRGYGWYDPNFRSRLSCNEARREVRRSGYRRVNAVECRGRTYTFRATRNDRSYVVYVDSRNGDVWR
jgi:hypothetical protein